MRIERLLVDGFRNLAPLRLELHERFSVLEGDNGQGKSNVLEAIAVLGGLRSFRTSRLGECVAFGAERAQLGARVRGRGMVVDLGLELVGNRSRVYLDGKAVARSSEVLGALVAVTFTAADLALPLAEPALRRRWLDRTVFHHDAAYLGVLRRYERALASRNALLRGGPAEGRVHGVAALDAYDHQLAAAAAEVSARRAGLVADLSPRVGTEFAAFAEAGRAASLRYQPRDPGLEDGASVEARCQAYLRRLAERRSLDQRRGVTSVGPHRDDIVLELDGRAAREHASAGQSRALVLAIKIAELRSLEAALGEPPVLLMDDVSSELDRRRNAALMHHLDAFGGQVVLTTTDAAFIQLQAPRGVWRVHAGALQQRWARPSGGAEQEET